MTPRYPDSSIPSLKLALADQWLKLVVGPLLFKASSVLGNEMARLLPEERRAPFVTAGKHLHAAGLLCFHPLRPPRPPLFVALLRLCQLADLTGPGDQDDAADLREQLAAFVPGVLQAEEQALVKDLARRLRVQLDSASHAPKE